MRWVLVMLLLTLPVCGWAQAPSLAWRAAPQSPTVGDTIRAELVLTHPSGTTPEWGEDAPLFEEAEAASDVTGNTVTDPDGNRISSRVYTLYADLPGTVTLPKTGAAVATPGGGRVPVTAEAVALTVAGVFDPAHPPELAPAKGPLAVPVSWGPYLAAGLVALAGLAALAWWLRRRRPQETVAVETAPKIPPHELALARLDALDPALPPREFFGELSEIARAYLAGRYGIPALQMTSSEVARAAGERGDLRPVSDWLGEWDLIKFARVRPAPQVAPEALARVREWVAGSAAGAGEPSP